MFDNVNIKYDHNKDIYTITGMFGNRFKTHLEKRILNSSRLKQLFITYGPFEISFYGFFALEVRVVLLSFMDKYSTSNVRTVSKTIEVLETQTWLNDITKEYKDDFDYKIITEKFIYEPLEHQLEWFKEYNTVKNRMHYRGRLLDAVPGSGKTYLALSIAELIFSNKVLIIAPKQAIEQVWVASLTHELYRVKQEYYIIGSKAKYNNEKFIISSYESLNKISDVIPSIKGKETTIIVDESHNMNELDSKRTNRLLNICNSIDSNNILMLSGTPIKARPLEMVPMLELLDKRFNKLIKQRFIKLYKGMPNVLKDSISERYTTYRTKIKEEALGLKPVVTKEYVVKLKNAKEYTLDSIKKKMELYVKARRIELLKDMDKYEKTYKDLYEQSKELQLHNGIHKREFSKYEDSVKLIRVMYSRGKLMDYSEVIKEVNLFEKNVIRPMLNSSEKVLFDEAKTIVKYMNLKIQGEVLGKVVGRERINCHRDMAKVIDYKKLINSTVKKTLIFSNNVEVCEAAYEVCDKVGYHPLKVYGEDTKYLNSTVDKFMVLNNEMNPLITTYKSLSTAVPLISANVMICLDLPFRSYVMEQAIKRLSRIGQDKQVIVHQVQLDTGKVPNINSRNIDIIAWSAEMVSIITGEEVITEVIKNEGTEEGEDTLNIDELISSLEDRVVMEEKKSIIDMW